VVCGNADVRGVSFDRLQHRVQHTGNRAEGRVVAFGESAQAVEMTEQLVGAVDEMDDHAVVG